MSESPKFEKCVMCSTWWHRTKMERGLCQECRRRLDVQAALVDEQTPDRCKHPSERT